MNRQDKRIDRTKSIAHVDQGIDTMLADADRLGAVHAMAANSEDQRETDRATWLRTYDAGTQAEDGPRLATPKQSASAAQAPVTVPVGSEPRLPDPDADAPELANPEDERAQLAASKDRTRGRTTSGGRARSPDARRRAAARSRRTDARLEAGQ